MTFAARDGTLEALIGSGNLGLITDSRTRDKLVEWKSRLGDISEDATEVLAESRRVLERMGEMGGPWSAGGVEATMDPAFAEAMSHFGSADLTVAVNDAELMARARTKRFVATSYLLELERLAEHAESVLALIGANRR